MGLASGDRHPTNLLGCWIMSSLKPSSPQSIFGCAGGRTPKIDRSHGGSTNTNQQRRGGQDYSSPVAADGKLFFTSRGGDIFVIKLGEKFEQLAVNRVTDAKEDFSATPAVSNGDLFIRSSKHLYCVGLKDAAN